jgi:hypothetical protein
VTDGWEWVASTLAMVANRLAESGGQMNEPVIQKSTDPVYVRRAVDLVELRIGDEGPKGATRYVMLTPGEARLVAYALLTHAERVASGRE